MLDNVKNLMNALKGAKMLREKMEEVQKQLATKTATGEAGAGAVTVTVNGNLDVVGVKFDRAMIATLAGSGNEADAELIEDLVVAATNTAMANGKALVQVEMQRIAPTLGLPGMEGLGQ